METLLIIITTVSVRQSPWLTLFGSNGREKETKNWIHVGSEEAGPWPMGRRYRLDRRNLPGDFARPYMVSKMDTANPTVRGRL
jgi:hypothetical protein